MEAVCEYVSSMQECVYYYIHKRVQKQPKKYGVTEKCNK